MRRGTTPTHTFTLPIEAKNVSDALIVYFQGDKKILRKTASECHMEGNTISVDLTQEETLRFRCDKAQIQVKVLTTDGKALVSNIITTEVLKSLADEVLK